MNGGKKSKVGRFHSIGKKNDKEGNIGIKFSIHTKFSGVKNPYQKGRKNIVKQASDDAA